MIKYLILLLILTISNTYAIDIVDQFEFQNAYLKNIHNIDSLLIRFNLDTTDNFKSECETYINGFEETCFYSFIPFVSIDYVEFDMIDSVKYFSEITTEKYRNSYRVTVYNNEFTYLVRKDSVIKFITFDYVHSNNDWYLQGIKVSDKPIVYFFDKVENENKISSKEDLSEVEFDMVNDTLISYCFSFIADYFLKDTFRYSISEKENFYNLDSLNVLNSIDRKYRNIFSINKAYTKTDNDGRDKLFFFVVGYSEDFLQMKTFEFTNINNRYYLSAFHHWNYHDIVNSDGEYLFYK